MLISQTSKKKFNTTVYAMLLVFSLSACETTKEERAQVAGVVVGALVGAFLGAQFGKGTGQLIGAQIGASIGAVTGRHIALNLSREDKEIAANTELDALENAEKNESVSWANADSGASGTVTPHNTFESDDGLTCRYFTHVVVVEDKKHPEPGKACKQSDGTWQIAG